MAAKKRVLAWGVLPLAATRLLERRRCATPGLLAHDQFFSDVFPGGGVT